MQAASTEPGGGTVEHVLRQIMIPSLLCSCPVGEIREALLTVSCTPSIQILKSCPVMTFEKCKVHMKYCKYMSQKQRDM